VTKASSVVASVTQQSRQRVPQSRTDSNLQTRPHLYYLYLQVHTSSASTPTYLSHLTH